MIVIGKNNDTEKMKKKKEKEKEKGGSLSNLFSNMVLCSKILLPSM